MAKAIIIFGSTTGNTELLSHYIASGMQSVGMDVTIKNVTDSTIDDLYKYEVILLGSSTWGNGELQDDFIDFYDEMEGLFLGGKKAAAFGPGDSTYEEFCEAVDMLENRLKECGAEIVATGLKVDGEVLESQTKAVEWGKQMGRVTA